MKTNGEIEVGKYYSYQMRMRPSAVIKITEIKPYGDEGVNTAYYELISGEIPGSNMFSLGSIFADRLIPVSAAHASLTS